MTGFMTLLAAFPCSQNAHAQSTFASTIVGTVRDTSGAVVPGAALAIQRLDDRSVHNTVADNAGAYVAMDLVSGDYEITATKYGFTTATTKVSVDSRRQLHIDLVLERAASAASGPAPAPAKGEAKSALAQELDAMRERIAQLEALVAKGDAQDQRAPSGPLLATAAANANSMPALPGSLGKPAEDNILTAGLPTTSRPRPNDSASAAAQAPDAAAAAPAAPPAVDMVTPFADWDWTWLNGNSRQHDSPLDSKYYSGEFRADTFYVSDFNQPIDHTMGGSSEIFRSSEVQLEDLSIGGDFHAGQMRGRVLALFGMFAATTVRNDASPGVGQWDVRAAYKYVSEAYGGYHFNVNHGLNIDAGIFVSYVGLFSYHNFDNWAYQPSYVSSNTPWFFNGVRIQWFPTHHLKIEPWFINGWQSYNRFNGHPGLGGQLKWTPKEWLNVIANQYGVGNDNIGLPNRGRYHTDNSIEVKYYDKAAPGNGIDKMAFTFTADAGCETGDGVTCHGGHGAYNPVTGNGGPAQFFLGWMAYDRTWWAKDKLALTVGGGWMDNPGRYLTLVLPVNGADAISGTPYFAAYPGAPMKAYDTTTTLDWMPSQFVTFRWEFGYRHSNVPYFSGRHGSTPPGGNNGSPADYVCSNGSSSGQTALGAAYAACGGPGTVWFPDLREGQATLSMMIMVKL